MSLTEIESELEKLAPDELRRLALKTWSTFVQKEGGPGASNWCDEDDPQVLAALDEAVQRADTTPGRGHSGEEVQTRIGAWTSK
jgi:hypothetical protein